MANRTALGAAATIGSEILRLVGLLRLDETGSKLCGIEATDGDSLAVSSANEGRLRYNRSTNRWERSENGGAYVGFASAAPPATADVILYGSSVNASVPVLTTDGAAPGAGNRLVIPSNNSYGILVTASAFWSVGGNQGVSAVWHQVIGIRNDDGTTTLQTGTVNLTHTTNTWATADWKSATYVGGAIANATLIPTADDANDCLNLTFTSGGGAGDTVKIVARCLITVAPW